MRYLVGILTVLVLIVSSCQKKQVKNPKTDLVDVNGLTLDKALFVSSFQRSKEFRSPGELTPEQVKKFIDDYFVSDFLIINEALSQGLENDSLVKSELENLKVSAMTGMNGPLYAKVMNTPATASEAEARALYKRSDHGVNIAYIRLSSKRQADSIYQAIRHGAEFADMARKHSLDIQTFQTGGKVRGTLYPGLLPKELEKVMFSMRAGQVSKPVYTAGWYYIIKVLKTPKMNLKSFAEEKDNFLKKVKQAKENNHRNNYIDSLFIRYHFQVHKDLFPVLRNAFVPIDRIGKIDESKIPHNMWNKPLVTYDGGQFKLGQFVSIYNKSNYGNRVPLREDDEIENHIKAMVVPFLMYQDGLSMGLQDSARYKELYQRYRLSQLERDALQKLVYSQVTVTDDEIKNYYEQHKNELKNQPFERVQEYVKNRLMSEKANEYKKTLVAKLRNKYDVVYNEPLIASVTDSMNKMKKTMGARPQFRAPMPSMPMQKKK
ncbi:hypothetical protein DRI50_03310 [candidate division KSB1 bacterium]|nr:MAG: hypothetical protein DRI50_03310 [candidate division KSB1 bacterium]